MAIHHYLVEHREKAYGEPETRLSPVAAVVVIAGLSALSWVGVAAAVRELLTLL